MTRIETLAVTMLRATLPVDWHVTQVARTLGLDAVSVRIQVPSSDVWAYAPYTGYSYVYDSNTLILVDENNGMSTQKIGGTDRDTER